MAEQATSRSSGETASTTPSGIDLVSLLGVIWRRRVPFAMAAVTTVVVCWFVVGQLTPSYTAETALILEVAKGEPVNVEPVVSSFSNSAAVTAALINSEIDIIRSPAVATKVIDQLNLMADPEFNPLARPQSPGLLDRFRSSPEPPKVGVSDERARAMVIKAVLNNLEIRQSEDSYTVRIFYKAGDPVLAASIANAFAELYLASRVADKSAAASRAADWVSSKLVELRKRVTRADQAVEEFRQAHDVVDLQSGTLTDQQLSRLGEELAAAAAERARQESALMEVTAAAAGSDNYSAPQLSASPVFQQLRAQEGAILAEIAQLRSEYGPRHVRMLETDRRLTELRDLLQAERSRVLRELETAARIARSQEAAMRAQVDGLRATRQDDDVAAIELRQLESEAAAARSLFDAFLTGLGRATAQIGVAEANARIVSFATPPLYPSYPPRSLLLVIAIIVGVLLGLVVVAYLELMDRSFRDPSALQHATAVRVVGLLPLLRPGGGEPDPQALVVERPLSAFSDAVHSVAAFSWQGPKEALGKVVMVTSSVPGEGKTTLSVALARATARMGKRVLLIDCDLWRPKVATYLNHKPRGGIVELVSCQATLEEVLCFDDASGLAFVPASGPARSPAEICSSRVLKALIEGAREDCDLVVLDTPPVGVVSDALILSRLVDDVLVMVRWGSTPRSAVIAAMRKLQIHGRPAGAAVFSHVDLRRFASYEYYPTHSAETYFKPSGDSVHQAA